jgi:flagellar protein FlgJ
LDLTTAERLASASDPKALSALKNRGNDPVAAKAVAGQFAALLMQNVMQGSDGAAMPVAGGGVGGNIVSGLFASTLSQAASSGDKLGLAHMLFRSIEAKQQAAAGNDGDQASGKHAAAVRADRQGAPGLGAASGFSLNPYWHGNGLRPFASVTANKNPVPSAGAGAEPAPGSVAGHWPAAVSSNAPARMISSTVPPSSTNDTLPRSSTPPRQVQSFAHEIRPALVEASRQLGVSPRILLAHAALETGWGRSVVGNNLFGIKANASWQGEAITTATHEIEAGERVSREAAFRAYPSLDASVQDYVALIGGNPRYQGLIGAGDNVEAYGRGLVAGGYATDTDYGSKLEAVAAKAAAAFATPSEPGQLGPFAAARDPGPLGLFATSRELGHFGLFATPGSGQ